MIALFPGSFDPITLGHEDIISRASKVFDEIIVGVAMNNKKKSMLSFDQRLGLVKSVFDDVKNVSVLGYKGLTINFLGELDVSIIIRGLRSEQDFIYESEISGNELDDTQNFLDKIKKDPAHIMQDEEIFQQDVDLNVRPKRFNEES